jgi:hypothetical protein
LSDTQVSGAARPTAAKRCGARKPVRMRGNLRCGSTSYRTPNASDCSTPWIWRGTQRLDRCRWSAMILLELHGEFAGAGVGVGAAGGPALVQSGSAECPVEANSGCAVFDHFGMPRADLCPGELGPSGLLGGSPESAPDEFQLRLEHRRLCGEWPGDIPLPSARTEAIS